MNILLPGGSMSLTKVQAAMQAAPGFLPGMAIPYRGSALPAGWLWEDGAQYSSAVYPDLYAAIGSTYNTGGEASGWFRVPDKRGRADVGRDDMGGTAAGRVTVAGSGVNGATLGATGGSQTHTLTVAQMPQHNHNVTDPGHIHTSASNSLANSGGPQFAGYSGSGGATISTASATTGITIQNNGSGQAHPIMQPSLVCNKIIKY